MNSNRAETWKQELVQRAWESAAAHWLALLACSACFLRIRDFQPTSGTTHNGLDSSSMVSNSDLMEAFSQLRLPL